MHHKLLKTSIASIFLYCLTNTAMAAPPQGDGGYGYGSTNSVKQEQNLSEVELPVSNGDIRPVLAVAAKYGRSKGVFIGKVAAQVQKQFGSAVVKVKAVRMQELDKGCPKVVAIIYQEGTSTQQEIPFRVCPNNK